MTAAFLHRFMPYGAPELQDSARPFMVRALALSSLAASLAFAVAWAWSLAWVGSPAPRGFDLGSVTIVQIPPPPPILQVREPEPVAPAKPANAVAAIPVPVPEAAAPDNTTVMDQQQLQTTTGEGVTGTPPLVVAPPETDGPLNRPGEFVYVDQLPEAVRVVKPEYSELARQAQVEGVVYVNVLVGKDGRVVEARLDAKRHVPLLDEAALGAACQWVFTPALTNNHPVMVWVSIPFRFSLRN